MRKLGYTSALHLITLNDEVRRLIPHDCPYVCSNRHDTVYPHLIVQFGGGDRVRAGEIDIRAPQANRLIYHCNADRIAMKLNPDFADLLTEARVLLISGFNAMQSRRRLNERLTTVAGMLERLPGDATVYLEDGGYYDPAFRQAILRRLGGRITVFSLNEDGTARASPADGAWASGGGAKGPGGASQVYSGRHAGLAHAALGAWLMARALDDMPPAASRGDDGDDALSLRR